MYFLVNASPSKPLDVVTLNFADVSPCKIKVKQGKLKQRQYALFLFVLFLYVPVNHFSVKSGRAFLR